MGRELKTDYHSPKHEIASISLTEVNYLFNSYPGYKADTEREITATDISEVSNPVITSKGMLDTCQCWEFRQVYTAHS